MHYQDLQRRVRLRPFQPFRIVLTDGTMYDIRHPEMIFVGKRTSIVGFSSDPADTAFERAVDIDMFHVIRAEPIETPTSNNNP
jgi:hypothetical protein